MSLNNCLINKLKNLHEITYKINKLQRRCNNENMENTIKFLISSRQKLKNEITVTRKLILAQKKVNMSDKELKIFITNLNQII